MTKLLQINITANWGSHGKIAEGIGLVAMEHGWSSHIAYGRWFNESKSELYHIGSMWDERVHGVVSRLFDAHGLASAGATKELIKYIRSVSPDIIHLHNIHGYYLNYPILFNFLKEYGKPVVWTLHDCWPYTGHCAHYMYVKCDKWKTECHDCQQKSAYPKSMGLDRSRQNFLKKKEVFSDMKNLTIVPVSKWLEGELKDSFLSEYTCHQIYNGIDINVFTPCLDTEKYKEAYHIPKDKHIILGVASNWYRKGLPDFIKLFDKIDTSKAVIVLVGLHADEKKHLPEGIIGISRTENVNELVALYSMASVFFNPSLEDNFPTTILESLACGTPVVTYNTGGCGEALTNEIGAIVNQGDREAILAGIERFSASKSPELANACRTRIVQAFNKDERFNEYFNMYKSIISKQ